MKEIIFKGCGTAIITPFKENGDIDFDGFKKLIENQIANEVDALIVCGTTGEASTMTKDERKQVIEFALKTVNKRIPVIAGTGSNCTKDAIEMTKWAEGAGCDGALVVTPYYNKTTQLGLVAHYTAIAQSVKMPIIMYNVPGRTGLNIKPETCLELSKVPNIVAIKEASGDLAQVKQIHELCGYELSIYSGNDDQIVPIMDLGGIGVISVLSHVAPKFTHNMTKEFFNGNIQKARQMQEKCLPLCKALFCEVNPIPVKYAMSLQGYTSAKPRLPLIEASDNAKKMIETAIKEFEA